MKTLIYLVLMFCVQAKAQCIPANHAYIPDGSFFSLVNQTDFKSAIKTVKDEYADEVKSHGATLKIMNKWSDGTVNSQAYRKTVKGKEIWYVDAFGGLARYPGMTKEAYIAVLCHEMGHHLGGAPKYDGNDWASNEGEADYFATLKCLKRLKIDGKDPSLVLATILADLGDEPVPSRTTRDKSAVDETNDDHPAAQCRLDTYDAGDACTVAGDMSDTDPKAGACFKYDKKFNPIGAGNRPRCWFHP